MNIEWGFLSKEFEDSSTEEILNYSLTELLKHGDIIFLTAFGPEGCVILKMIKDLVGKHEIQLISSIQGLKTESKSGRLAIANLDTGYQFKETLELKDKLEDKYKMPILMIQAELSIEEQNNKYGKDLFAKDPDQCCYMRKIVPLNQLLTNRLAWISSIRRDQSPHRANAQCFEYDKKFKLGKINPILKWSKSDIWKYIHENQIPYNPLLDQGYDSIGCEPCTKPGEGRQGRWAGQDKIECGLHLQDQELTQGGEFTI